MRSRRTKWALTVAAVIFLIGMRAGVGAESTNDALGRLTHIEYADGTTIDYTYDADGNQLDRIVTRPVELTVTVDPPGAGTVTGAGSFRRNTTTALTATAGSAFIFDAWKRLDGSTLSTEANYTHTITGPETLIATFVVIEAPVITTHPASGSHTAGTTLNLSVIATGRPPLTYLWRHNGSPLASTEANLSIPAASFLNAGTYVAEVTGPGGTTTSQSALITIPIPDYTTWRNAIFTPAEIAANDSTLIGLDAKIGSDGLTNRMHFALGSMNRFAAPGDSFQLIRSGTGAGSFEVFAYRKLIGSGGLRYRVSISSDLTTWDDSEQQLELDSPNESNVDGITEQVRVRLKPNYRDSVARTFFRLVVGEDDSFITIFSDYFTSNFDPKKWTLIGNTSSISNGYALLRTTVTDQGPTMTSSPISFDPTKPISISRDAILGYGNDKSIPSVHLNIGSLPQLGVHYGNMAYDSGIYRSVIGLFLARNGANPHIINTDSDIAGPFAMPWQKWFHEQIVYQPLNGQMDYYQDEALIGSLNVGTLTGTSPQTMSFSTNAWCWYTGNVHQLDNFEISQPLSSTSNAGPRTHVYADHFSTAVDPAKWNIPRPTVEWNGGQAWVKATDTTGLYGYMTSKTWIPIDLTRPIKITITGSINVANRSGVPRRLFWFGSLPFVTAYAGDLTFANETQRAVDGTGICWNGTTPWRLTSDGFRTPEVPYQFTNRNKCEYEYNPLTGVFRYLINGNLVHEVNVGAVPPGSPQRMAMQIDASGSGTGHAQLIDYIHIDQ